MRIRFLLLSSVGLTAALPLAQATAAVNLVENGSFEITTNGPGQLIPGQTSGTDITSATGWYTQSTSGNAGSPFLFVVAPNTADTTGFPDHWDSNQQRYIWGPGNGVNNGFTGVSPDGGNFLLMDGDYHRSSIYQNVGGLQVGQTYTVSFDWAAAQWKGNTGATTEQVQSTIDGVTTTTTTYNLPSQGFSGWMTQSYNFTYTGASDVLSLLAVGTPSGEPPLVLLDGVSIFAAPGPTPSAGASLIALAAIGASVLRRRRQAPSV